ncbi:MAG: hypothetical protein RL110_1909 [Bacteroidota bacterium]|jgi:hypothetical protein
MSKKLSGLNIMIWNNEKKTWVKMNTDISKGIYLILFKPQNSIYEVRNLSKKPTKKHVINKNEIVLKPGKFMGGLKNRIFGSLGYAKYWKDEGQDEDVLKRTESDCFKNSTTIYLIANLSDYEKENEWVELVEVFTKLTLKRQGNVQQQETINSEYYRYTKSEETLMGEITTVRNEVEAFLDYLKLSGMKSTI